MLLKDPELEIITIHSPWFILLCILLGLLYAAILYYKERNHDFPLILKWIMGISRMVVISLIAFFLLEPLMKTQKKYTEEPLIILAQDNSQSIISGKDSSYYLNDYKQNLNNLIANIEQKYTLKKYTFGDGTSEKFELDFQDKITDFSEFFDEVDQRLSGRNIGAMIIASDGLFNKGLNPLYASLKTDYPVYTIALGDTNIHKDIILTKVNYNRLAYQGNEFPIEIIVNGKMCKDQNSKLSVVHNGTEVVSKILAFKTENDFQTIRFNIAATEKGMHRYKINIAQIPGEINTDNNTQEIFIEILDGKQKILVLSNSPHPDVTAIKQALGSNHNYETEYFVIDKFNKNIAAYNMVILHNLPSDRQYLHDIFQKIKDNQLPVLYIIGSQTNLKALNRQSPGFMIPDDNVIYNEAQPIYNNSFTLFSLPESSQIAIASFPPLISPYGEYSISPVAQSMFQQKIGSLHINDPLILFYQSQDARMGYIVGEGIWRWRLANYNNTGNHQVFDDLLNRIVQFLSVKADKSQFRIFHKNNFDENQNIELEAELYNESYELVNDPEVTVTIMNSEGKRFPFTFSRTSRSYFLNAGHLPVDNYTYTAKVSWGNKTLSNEGIFTISALNIEKTNTIANHNLMYNIAVKRGGEMIYPDEMESLFQKMMEKDEVTSISYSRKKFSELLNLPWILALILGLLSIEWFIRKRSGSY